MKLNKENMNKYLLAVINEERNILESIERGNPRFGTTNDDQKTKLRLLRKIRDDLGMGYIKVPESFSFFLKFLDQGKNIKLDKPMMKHLMDYYWTNNIHQFVNDMNKRYNELIKCGIIKKQ